MKNEIEIIDVALIHECVVCDEKIEGNGPYAEYYGAHFDGLADIKAPYYFVVHADCDRAMQCAIPKSASWSELLQRSRIKSEATVENQ